MTNKAKLKTNIPLDISDIPIPSERIQKNDCAKTEYFRVCTILRNKGLLSDLDLAALEMYCVCWAEYNKLLDYLETTNDYAQIHKSGLEVRSLSYMRFLEAEKRMRSLIGQLGFLPTKRTSLKANNKEEKYTPISDLLEG